MSSYPLAHDENGIPLDIPATATGWLVRRHSGGKGRPGAVYDADGRPLVASLDSTAGDLRGFGCRPGRYRLEAVDADRRPLGVVAFTEVGSATDGEDAPEGAPSQDAAVAALARAVEAMQRVQAERERAQAEMFMRLIERLTPPPPQPAQDFRNAVNQFLELQKGLKKLAPEPAEPADASGAITPAQILQTVQQGMQIAGPLASRWLWTKMGLTDQQINEMQGAQAAVRSGTSTPANDAPAKETPPPAPEEPVQARTDDPHLNAVWAELSDEERAVLDEVIPTLPEGVIAQVQEQLATKTPQEGAAFLRQHIGPVVEQRRKSAKPNAQSNGAAA